VKPVTVLLTAAGSPGTAALLRAMRENGEREARVVGVDMSERSVGRHLCDAFHVVAPSSDASFVPTLLEIVKTEGVDAVLPQSSYDLPALAAARDEFPVPVLVSSPETVRRSNDKAETYALLRALGITAPDFRRVRGAAAVDAAARELGYPDRDVAVKPVFS
jgi:carbamoylphosphate synthase large subunit